MKRDRIDRQQFLRLMGASLGLMGLTACSIQPAKSIVPYVRQPEEIIPGKPLFYASATVLGGYAFGILVKTTMGRPIKVEGNVNHPASLGATDVFGQATVLTLYDPDRSPMILNNGQPRSWDDFLQALTSSLDDQRSRGGVGLRVLTETVTSPSLADQLQRLLEQFPHATWHQYDPVNRDNPLNGALQAFGEYVETQYRFDQAEVILALDADFLGVFPGHLRYAHDFAETRRIATGRTNMSRLYSVESSPTITGAVADHRWSVRASDVAVVAAAVAAKLGLSDVISPGSTTNALSAQALTAIAKDLDAHRGTSVIVVGDQQPAAVHLLGHRLNQLLGNVGKTIFYTDPVAANPIDQTASLRDLARAMRAGQVDMLLILGSNPVYYAPADLSFGDALTKVAMSVHLGLYQDETAALTTWHVPQAHELEAWSDARAFDGTVTILQPTIAPLYGGKTISELLGIVIGAGEPTSLEVVQGYWQRRYTGTDFQQFWRTSLSNGLVADTALSEKNVKLTAQSGSRQREAGAPSPPPAPPDLEIIFRPDPTIHDGRFANNGWLQELPKPLTTLTWDNVAQLSPATARRLGLKSEDLVELTYRGRTVRAPVWVTPDHPDEAVTVQLGFGRTRAGKIGNGVGFNAYLLRTSEASWFDTGPTLRPVGQQYPLARTQGQQTMEGRPILLNATLAQYRADPRFAPAAAGGPDGSLYPPVAYPGYAMHGGWRST